LVYSRINSKAKKNIETRRDASTVQNPILCICIAFQ
jgi:hypothetical protein